MDNPTSPAEFRCALFVDSGEFASWTGMGEATGTNAPFCATLTEAMSGSAFDGAALWSMASSAAGGKFFAGVEGYIDLSGGYTATSAYWTDGGNIGGYVMASDMAIVGEDEEDAPTASVAPTFIFSEGKVCYESPPLWNGQFPDAFGVYAMSVQDELCLTKIA